MQQQILLEYILNFSFSHSPLRMSFQCLEEAGGDWTEVSKCVDGDEGKKLQLIAENQTKEISKPRLENVPTIVFNNVCNLL